LYFKTPLGQALALEQPDKRQDGENDYDGADDINDVVHDIFPLRI
jgi:hypothetical protein